MSIPTNREPKIVLSGAHRWSRQPVVDLARNAGLDPILLLYEKEDVPDELLSKVQLDHVIRQSKADTRSAVKIAETVSRDGAEWYSLGLDDYVCEFAAELSTYSSKKMMPASAAKETLHKHRLRLRWNELCERNALLFPVPFRLLLYSDATFVTKICEEENLAFNEFTPLIVKPDALDASIGIHNANSWAEAEGSVSSIQAELASLAAEVIGIGIDISPAILIEHRIPRSRHLHAGAEFSAEFLSTKLQHHTTPVHRFLGMTQKYINQETFVEVAHCFPSETFPTQLLDTVQEVTADLLDQLEVEFCISHWEYIVTDDERLALVEAQLRPAGDRIIDLVWRATDCNPYHVLFGALRGDESFVLPPFSVRRKAAVFFPQPERLVRGKLSLVRDTHTDKMFEGSLFLGSDFASASVWGSQPQWYSKHVALLAEGQTFESARKQCEKMLSFLRVRCQLPSGEEERVCLSLPSL